MKFKNKTKSILKLFSPYLSREILIIPALFYLLSCARQSSKPAGITLAVINGNIWTGLPAQPKAEALAVSGNKITAVGSNSDIRKLIGKDTRIIDAKGQMVVPGFIDSHIHFIEGGFRLSSVQLRDAKTKEEFVARIKAFAGTIDPGVWITGGDWDHEQWGGELPHRDWIDAVTPDNPVWVSRLDGHMALANSVTMNIAKITKDTPNVEGGTIVRSEDGQPTGIFKENSMGLIYNVEPDPPDQLKDRALNAAMQYVAEQGVTSVHHMGTWDDLAVFERAHKAEKLRTRILAAVPLSTWNRLQEKVAAEGHGDQWLRFGGLKGFVDGSLGSHTAAFFEPYTDTQLDSGVFVNSPEDLYRWISNADKADLQVIIHAIGDRANHTLINIYERVVQENGQRDRRFRIEHAQHLIADDIPRFNSLKVIASMQPYHAIDDGRWAEKVIGPERIKTTYAFRSLLDDDAHLVFGSDWYVAPPIPLAGIYAAVTRRTLDDKNPDGWVAQQKITVKEALRAYTVDAAYASFEENLKGSLEPGKLADFVIIDRDLMSIPPEEIREAKVTKTVVDGNVVFER